MSGPRTTIDLSGGDTLIFTGNLKNTVTNGHYNINNKHIPRKYTVDVVDNPTFSTSVNIEDASGVYFSTDASFNESGPKPANFLIDFSGNLIMHLNNFYFRYSIVDVATTYNGERE